MLRLSNFYMYATDYRQFMTQAIAERRKRNESYSLRAFARDVGVKPSQLSEIFNGRKGLSIDKAYRIATMLGLSESETTYFCDLVEVEHGRSSVARQMAKARVERFRGDDAAALISQEMMTVISDWYHLAILYLTDLPDFDPDPMTIARRLGLSVVEVKSAIERLLRLNLLSNQDGVWKRTSRDLVSTQEIPSQGIREFHRQMLAKAASALDNQPIESRTISSITMAIDTRKIPEAKARIESFRRELCALLQSSENFDGLYTMGIQLFSLQQPVQH